MNEAQNIRKEYTNGEVTVVWQPGICVHSTVCWKEATGLPAVFNPKVRPWVNISGADTAAIVEQVKKCPSGALSFYYNKDGAPANSVEAKAKVEVLLNGPLLVYGNITVKDQHGNETKKSKVTAFCRCGLSGSKPYCDGSHTKTNLDG